MAKTVYDVAREAGVSIATVSRVLSGSDVVSLKTRKNVIEKAKELGFHPNQSARRLAGSKSGLIGFIASQLRNPAYLDYFHTLEALAKPRGYEVLIADSELSYKHEWANIERMLKNQVEALMVFPVDDILGNAPASHIKRFRTLDTPCILLGIMRGLNLTRLTVDEHAGAAELACGLIQRGFKKLIFVTESNSKNRPARERQESLCENWMRAHQHNTPPTIIRIPEMDSITRNSATFGEIIAAIQNTSDKVALVTVNEYIAYSLYGPLNDAGISIPRDVALASFGCSSLANCFRPQLTLVEAQHEEVAKAASEQLFQMITPNQPEHMLHLIPCRVVWRESTKAQS